MIYVVTTGKTACASNAAKVAVELATGSGVLCRVVGFDVSFDGATSTATPIRFAIVKASTASTGGGAGTLNAPNADGRTVQTTCRINDTTPGTATTTFCAWEIPPTSGFSYQWPLGRELEMGPSSYWEFQVITVTGSGTPNYDVNVWVEEG